MRNIYQNICFLRIYLEKIDLKRNKIGEESAKYLFNSNSSNSIKNFSQII